MNFNIDDVIVFNDGEYLILDVIRENNNTYLYLINNDEFIEHMCTIVSNKKHIQEYIINKSIIENWQHYVSWLELHDKSDNWESKCDYMTICLGWEETFSKYG